MMLSTDYCYINEDGINPFLKCPICSKPFVDPVIRNNNIRSCRACISSDENNQNFILLQEKLVLDLLDDLRVQCKQCKEINIRRGDFKQHMTMTCTQRIVSCESADLNCSWTGSYEELNNHLKSCHFYLLRPIFTQILTDIKQINEQTIENKISSKEDYKLQYDQLKQEFDQLKEQYNRYEIEMKQLKNQNEQIEKENLFLKQELTRIDQFEQIYNQLQIEIEQLKQQLIKQNTLSKNLQSEIHYIKQNNEIEQLKQQMNRYEKLSEYINHQNISSLQQQLQKDEITSIRQLVNQHDIQIKLLARRKCVIPIMISRSDVTLEKLIEESLNNSEIDLDGKKLVDHDIDIVYKKGIIEKKCTKLRLQNNQITGKGATILANALYNNKTLTELYLSKNQISDIGVHSLVQTLSINNLTLQLLDLHSNNITDEGAEYLAEMLKINKTIIRLGLGFNQITDHGVQLLMNVITYYNENLQWLSLSSNKFITDKSISYFIEMLTYNLTLKTLWLNDCNLSIDSITRLKQKIITHENFVLEI